MEKQKSPKGFIVVLPGEIIEIPQDSDKSWLTLFYSLPRELAEKWKPAYELPRCPYEVLRTDKYEHIVCDDTLGGKFRTRPNRVVGAGVPARPWAAVCENVGCTNHPSSPIFLA